MNKENKFSSITPLFILCLFIIIFGVSLSCKKNNFDPLVYFIKPPDNAQFYEDTTIVFEVCALDEDGKVKKVGFYIDDSLQSSLKNDTCLFEWAVGHDDIGTHRVKAIAYDNDDVSSAAEINISIIDYRDIYYGDFSFLVVKESWLLGESTTYDTIDYNGKIREYHKDDYDHVIYNTTGDKNKMITILFLSDQSIMSLIDKDGQLIEESGVHYYHEGAFINHDSIEFSVTGMGGLGGGWNYYVKGKRR